MPSVTVATPLTEQLPQVIRDLVAERGRQIEKGWTPEHDDTHSTASLVELVADRLGADYAPHSFEDLTREELVESTAILVATIEALDRERAAR